MLRAMRTQVRLVSALVLLLAFAPVLHACVTRVEITSRADVLNGQSFGDAGPYERITGRVYYSLAVANWHNTGIDFILVRPALVDGRHWDLAHLWQSGTVMLAASFPPTRPALLNSPLIH
jgi:hypothetical protein